VLTTAMLAMGVPFSRSPEEVRDTSVEELPCAKDAGMFEQVWLLRASGSQACFRSFNQVIVLGHCRPGCSHAA
jgi:hypothetical protein